MSDEYSEAARGDILARVHQWYDAFEKSDQFALLNKTEQQEAEAITEFFAQYAHDYLGESPAQWNPRSVRECCTEILPRKVTAEPVFFEAIAPVLSRFFNFLEAQRLLLNGRALAKAAEGSHKTLVANARDKRNWGPAKYFAMSALEAGVDVRDPAALDAFMTRFNEQLAKPLPPVISRPSGWLSGPGLAPAPAKPRVAAPFNRYDPCPCGSGKKYKFCCA